MYQDLVEEKINEKADYSDIILLSTKREREGGGGLEKEKKEK